MSNYKLFLCSDLMWLTSVKQPPKNVGSAPNGCEPRRGDILRPSPSAPVLSGQLLPTVKRAGESAYFRSSDLAVAGIWMRDIHVPGSSPYLSHRASLVHLAVNPVRMQVP